MDIDKENGSIFVLTRLGPVLRFSLRREHVPPLCRCVFSMSTPASTHSSNTGKPYEQATLNNPEA